MGDGGAAARDGGIDAPALRRWLVGDEVVDADGCVWSWHGGYRYPEAGGLWLSWIAEVMPDHPRAAAVARWLLDAVARDAVGRDGIAYSFDLGVVLAGLVRWHRACARPLGAEIHRGSARLLAAIDRAEASWPRARAARWSTRFGAHQRKLAVTLALLHDAGVADTRAARGALWQATGGDEPCFGPATAESTYVHASLYALEGAWVLGATTLLPHAARWLAQLQRAHGGLPAWWHAAHGAHGPSRSDATAQAVRLWCAVDRAGFELPIARALAFLAAQCDPAGGVRYDEGCAHRNVWCTLFAWQAHDFARHGARREGLL